ncbi:MAG: UDP-2,3-diacylglucosamine diphosphatase [Steroidobacteraceae bacterium]|nr:UDP-2,3-diacylglucosamine diphosphatase [Steroidobacteraceae bacterium]
MQGMAKFRSVFVSDVHLGSRGCRAELLLQFLNAVQTERLYLVGDIIDLWCLRQRAYWPAAHNDVIRAILDRAKAGVRVILVPGNHDEDLREFDGTVFGNVALHREFVHETADGRRLLVLHGDEFDGVVQCSPWLAKLGDQAYSLILGLNEIWSTLRCWRGLPYWSLAGYLKHKAPRAVEYIESFERAAAHAARRRGLDGVVCGHIHRASLRDIDGVLYCNDGDWVESCTALAEDFNGRLRLTGWNELCAAAHGPAAQPLGQAA